MPRSARLWSAARPRTATNTVQRIPGIQPRLQPDREWANTYRRTTPPAQRAPRERSSAGTSGRAGRCCRRARVPGPAAPPGTDRGTPPCRRAGRRTTARRPTDARRAFRPSQDRLSRGPNRRPISYQRVAGDRGEHRRGREHRQRENSVALSAPPRTSAVSPGSTKPRKKPASANASRSRSTNRYGPQWWSTSQVDVRSSQAAIVRLSGRGRRVTARRRAKPGRRRSRADQHGCASADGPPGRGRPRRPRDDVRRPGRICWSQPGQRYAFVEAAPVTRRTTQSSPPTPRPAQARISAGADLAARVHGSTALPGARWPPAARPGRLVRGTHRPRVEPDPAVAGARPRPHRPAAVGARSPFGCACRLVARPPTLRLSPSDPLRDQAGALGSGRAVRRRGSRGQPCGRGSRRSPGAPASAPGRSPGSRNSRYKVVWMASATSRPMTSSSSNGPIGYPQPTFMAASMSSARRVVRLRASARRR